MFIKRSLGIWREKRLIWYVKWMFVKSSLGIWSERLLEVHLVCEVKVNVHLVYEVKRMLTWYQVNLYENLDLGVEVKNVNFTPQVEISKTCTWGMKWNKGSLELKLTFRVHLGGEVNLCFTSPPKWIFSKG